VASCVCVPIEINNSQEFSQPKVDKTFDSEENGGKETEMTTEEMSVLEPENASVEALDAQDEENVRLVRAWDELEAAAYHEAGHAIVGSIYGFRLKLISIESGTGKVPVDKRCLRFCDGIVCSPIARETAGYYAVFLAAGVIAEGKFTGKDWKSLKFTVGKVDYDEIRRIAELTMLHNPYIYCPIVSDGYITLWEQKAVAILSDSHIWAAVEYVANAVLDACEPITGRELERLISKAKE
jgi:hypothetical protein